MSEDVSQVTPGWAIVIRPGPIRLYLIGGTEDDARQYARGEIAKHGTHPVDDYEISVRATYFSRSEARGRESAGGDDE